MEAPDDLSSSLGELLDKAPQEAEAIWSEFFPRMLKLAKAKLGGMQMRTFDEEDVALSAMNSFFRGKNDGRFDRLDSRDEMWRLLATITVRKVTAQRRKAMADQRGAGAIRGESIFFNPANADSSMIAGLGNFSDDRLLPDTTEEILKNCEHLLEKLDDEKLRRTAIMRLEGYSNQEISEELGCSVARTKQRLQRIRELWGELPEGE
jgi:DNA-directed RNA polymerase specialized sigma24 family protein